MNWNQELFDKWIKELREGGHKQINGILGEEEEDAYCCLGILCIVASNIERLSNALEESEYNSLCFPPKEIAEELSLDSHIQLWMRDCEYKDILKEDVYLHSYTVANYLAYLNDNENWDFNQIADWLLTHYCIYLERRDRLASVQHDIWSHWMNYMWTKCPTNPDGSRTIPEELVERWTRQMNSSYKELPIEERGSDIRQAAKMMNELNVIYEIVME